MGMGMGKEREKNERRRRGVRAKAAFSHEGEEGEAGNERGMKATIWNRGKKKKLKRQT